LLITLDPGVAGLHAAFKLGEIGIRDVVILEALDRIGGRIHTIPVNGDVVELGAQWIHGQVSIFPTILRASFLPIYLWQKNNKNSNCKHRKASYNTFVQKKQLFYALSLSLYFFGIKILAKKLLIKR